MDTAIVEKPKLLQAVELLLAKPEDIQKEAQQLLANIEANNPSKSASEIRKLVAKKVISNYSYYSAFTGGATALAGVVPGIGTAVTVFGGATADAALSMKYQIEMTMALASVYGHNIRLEEEKRLCFIIAGLGALNEAAKDGGKAVGSKAFVRLAREHLKGATLKTIKAIFNKVGITFTRKAAEKVIPFGVGVVIGFSANKGLSWYVGTKARDFFEAKA